METSNIKEYITEKEVFDKVKESVLETGESIIDMERQNLLAYADKLNKTGQVDVAKKVLYNLDVLENREKELVLKTDIRKYVKKDLLIEYMDKCKNRTVVLNFIENYPREIPTEVVNKYEEIKALNIFDTFLIVFTDYTGEARAKVEEEAREKDPILFGLFADLEDKLLYDKLFFIADWEDEFCDLTLDKLIQEQREVNITNAIVGEISAEQEANILGELQELVAESERQESKQFRPLTVKKDIEEKPKKRNWFMKLFSKGK